MHLYVTEVTGVTEEDVTIQGFMDAPDGNVPVIVVLHGVTPLLADIGFP